jgi:predicted nuclease of predicted toxin-antitoxin system
VRTTPETGGLASITFFIDRSLGQEQVIRALKAQGATVERHDDHFAKDAPDPEWLAEVGARGWIVISKDKRIRYRGAERAAVHGAKIGLFIFIGGNMTGPQLAARIASALMQMVLVVETQERPFIATISKAGIVKVRDTW